MAVDQIIPGFRTSATPRARGPQVNEIQFDSLDQAINKSLELQGSRIDDLEETYASLKDIQDEVLGIRIDNPFQSAMVSKLKEKNGLDDSAFDMKIDDLENPYLVRNMKTKLSKISSSPEFADMVRNQTQKDLFEKNIAALKHTNPEMYKLALQDLIDYKNDENGSMTGLDLNFNNYQPINVTKEVQTLLNDLPVLTTESPKKDGDYVYVEKIKQRSKDLAETVVMNSLSDPKITNNLISQGYMTIEDGVPTFTDKGMEWKNTLIDEYTKKNVEIDSFKESKSGESGGGGTLQERTGTKIQKELAEQGLKGLTDSQAIAMAGGEAYNLADPSESDKQKYPGVTRMITQQTPSGIVKIPLYPMTEEEKKEAKNSIPKEIPKKDQVKQEEPVINKEKVENESIKNPDATLEVNSPAPVFNDFIGFLDWAENGGQGENAYGLDVTDSNNAVGRYQIEWDAESWEGHGKNIMKITGVKDKNEFLASPKAQDQYMQHLYDGYVKELPKLRSQNLLDQRNLSDNELLWAMHNRGTAKNVINWMHSDKFYDKNDPTTRRIHQYLDSQVDIVDGSQDEGPDKEDFVKNKNGAIFTFPSNKKSNWDQLSISSKKVLKDFPIELGLAVIAVTEPGHQTHKNGDEFDIRVKIPNGGELNERIGADGGSTLVQNFLNKDEMILYLYNNGYEVLYEGDKKFEEELNGKDYWAKPLFKVMGNTKYTSAPHLHFQRAKPENMKAAKTYLEGKGLLKEASKEKPRNTSENRQKPRDLGDIMNSWNVDSTGLNINAL